MKSERADVAVQGAKKLEVEVNEATKKIEDLLPILKEAEDGLKAKKYPTAVVGKLAGFAVPFKAENLDGKGAGNMPPGLQKQIFTFLKKCEDLEDKKNALKNVLGGLQKNLETAWAEEQKPMLKLAVSFSTSGGNTIAQMVRIKEPWEAGASSWPKEPKVLVPTVRDGRKTEEEKGATRWEKGDLTGSSPIVIPVDPSTVAQFTDEKVVFQLAKAIADIKLLLNGDSTPGNETNGLLKDGEVLSNDLGKLGMRR